MSRSKSFENAKAYAEEGSLDKAFEAIEDLPEMLVINTIICDKLTSCCFEEKKEACFSCLQLLEGAKLLRSPEWLELYTDAVYEVFSKLSRYVREEERSEAWSQVKDIFYEITLAAKKVWKEKNAPAGLELYVSYAKLIKSYFDVADEDSFKICESYSKEAKFVGKGILEDEDYRDAKKAIDTINKLINDAKQEREKMED